MSDDQDPKISPQEGVAAIMNLITGVTDAAGNSDLKAMDGILDQLGDIAGAAGLDMSEIGQQLAGIKGESAKAQRHFENCDAAMWAGDFVRWQALSDKGPELDYAKIHNFDGNYDPTELEHENTPATDAELAAFYEEAGIDPADLEQELLPDRYADIAAGKPGAVADFIATGQDPNIPTGDSQHTAFLAALDAPKRNVNDLQALIAAGADPTAIHAFGDTALSWAMGYRHLDSVSAESEMLVIALLAGSGIDVNHPLPDFGSPFHRALIEGDANQVAAMLAAGADPHAPMPLDFPTAFLAGATPIVAAAPKPAVVQLLLSHGVGPNAQCANGQTSVAFISDYAAAARARADETDPWTVAHAAALDETLNVIAQFMQANP